MMCKCKNCMRDCKNPYITENCKLLLDNNCGFLLFFQINMAEVLLQCDENLYVNQVKIVSLEG